MDRTGRDRGPVDGFADSSKIPEPIRSADLHPLLGPRADGARLESDRRLYRLRRLWQRGLLRIGRIHDRAFDALEIAGTLFPGPVLRRALGRVDRGVDWPSRTAAQGSLFCDRDVGRGGSLSSNRRYLG